MSVVLDDRFHAKNGMQIGVQEMTSCVAIIVIHTFLKKQSILEIMQFSW